MKPRQPVVAALLSLMVPGLGQLYDGAPLRALLVWLGAWAGVIAAFALLLSLRAHPANVLAAALTLLAAVIFAPVHAFRLARRARSGGRPFYDRWYVYAALLLVAFWLQPRIFLAVRSGFAEAFQLPSESMAPTLLAGDYLIVRTLPTGDARARLGRDDLAVFRSPNPVNGMMVKRIVGVPGDTVSMRRKVLFLNGRPVHEPFVQYVDRTHDLYVPSMLWQRGALAGDTANYRPSRDQWGPLVVPQHAYFVLGDNRDESEDSRYFGFVSERDMVGVPRTLYFSFDPADRTVRWARVGLPLD